MPTTGTAGSVRIDPVPAAPVLSAPACLLDLLSSELSVDPVAAPSPEPAETAPAAAARAQLAPIVCHPRAPLFQHSCNRNVERCPLYASVFSSALAGGEAQLHAVVHAYERWFFGRWMPRMTLDVASALMMLRMPSWDAADRFFERLLWGIELANASQSEIREIANHLTSSLQTLREQGLARLQERDPLWQVSLKDAQGLVHDLKNLIGSYKMTVTLARAQTDAARAIGFLEMLQGADFSSVHSIANLVATLNASRARKLGVRIQVNEMPHMVVPEEQQAALFRAINELVTNALKYADAGKAHRLIGIRAEPWHTFVRLHVTDNGVGINDIAAVFDTIGHGEGHRERPEMAEGDGHGLATILQGADRHRWGFYLVSARGIGTDAGIYLDICNLHSYAPQQQDDEPKKRRPTSPPGVFMAQLTRRISPAGSPEDETEPMLVAAVLDRSSLLKTIAIMGSEVNVYHYFPLDMAGRLR